MIQDARVLQEDFIPKEVEHRDSEVNQLSTALSPITEGHRAETAFLFGPSGVGKTCIAKYTIERLREEVLDINYQYVNCWEDYNRYRTLYRILEGIGRTVDIHRQSTPQDELLERVRTYEGPPYIVILDEVDQLKDRKILYDLYNTPRISMILIANQEDELFASLDTRVRSRLQSSLRIRFEKYTLDELVSILSARVQWGLSEGVIGTGELRMIADAAAGDARVAINSLRLAAQSANREGVERITPDIVDNAIPNARSEIHQKSIEQLTPDQRSLYEIIEAAGEITPGVLYEEYTERVDDPMTKRTIRNYLSKMGHYNLVEAVGKNRGRVYKVVR